MDNHRVMSSNRDTDPPPPTTTLILSITSDIPVMITKLTHPRKASLLRQFPHIIHNFPLRTRTYIQVNTQLSKENRRRDRRPPHNGALRVKHARQAFIRCDLLFAYLMCAFRTQSFHHLPRSALAFIVLRSYFFLVIYMCPQASSPVY